jgi:hypothetical protein
MYNELNTPQRCPINDTTPVYRPRMRSLHSVVQPSLLLHPLRASASDAGGIGIIIIIIVIIEMTAYTRTAAHRRPPSVAPLQSATRATVGTR